MKRLIVGAILLLATSANASDWTKTDTVLQATYTVFHVLDWSQTRWIAKNPHTYKDGQIRPVNESNLVLGKRPSTATVNTYFASTLLAHTAVSYLLPKAYRTYWQCVTIGFEGAVVAKNFNVGIKMDF